MLALELTLQISHFNFLRSTSYFIYTHALTNSAAFYSGVTAVEDKGRATNITHLDLCKACDIVLVKTWRDMDHWVDKNLAGWPHSKTCSQQLSVQVKWQETILTGQQGDSFDSSIDSGIKCTLSKFGTTPSCAVQLTHWRKGIWSRGILTGRCVRTSVNSTKPVQGAAAGSQQSQAQRQGGEWIESTPGEKHLRVLVDRKLGMNQQCVPAAQKANHILGCIKEMWPQGQGRWFFPSALLSWPHLEYCCQLWGSQHKTDVDLEWIQRRGWPHSWCTSPTNRLKELGLFRMEKRRLWRALRAAFQYVGGAYKKAGEGLLKRACRDRMGEMASGWKSVHWN